MDVSRETSLPAQTQNVSRETLVLDEAAKT